MPEAGFGALYRCCVVVACGLCAEPTTALGRILQRTKKATATVSPVSGAASTVKGATDGTRSRADVHIREPVGAQRDWSADLRVLSRLCVFHESVVP